MRSVIFDIDGTLTQTTTADADCFVRSLAEVCGFRDVNTDWSSYRHATDSGVFHEIHQARTGRSPSAFDVSQFRQHFVGLLEQMSFEAPFTAVRGASRLLARLADNAEYGVALATGAWRDSARLKMASAGLCYDNYPAASSDDALDRDLIIRLSIERAVEVYGKPSSTVYVGDGIWDARACRQIGIPFLGVATSGRADRLRPEGAFCVLPDLSDADLFFSYLNEISKTTS
jgi:phosphoglycolate phosphatase-like HAD superfamily hydrolase